MNIGFSESPYITSVFSLSATYMYNTCSYNLTDKKLHIPELKYIIHGLDSKVVLIILNSRSSLTPRGQKLIPGFYGQNESV